MKNEDQAWLDYRARFAEVYDESNYASPLQSAVMRASHRLTEKNHKEYDHFAKVLEIGAGTGEHLSFVRHGFDQYVLSDLDAKTLKVAKGKLNGKFGNRLLFETQSGAGVSYADNSFDRLIATHVLEHIYQPHLALKEWQRVVKNGGVLSVLIPTDPGVAWRLGRHWAAKERRREGYCLRLCNGQRTCKFMQQPDCVTTPLLPSPNRSLVASSNTFH